MGEGEVIDSHDRNGEIQRIVIVQRGRFSLLLQPVSSERNMIPFIAAFFHPFTLQLEVGVILRAI